MFGGFPSYDGSLATYPPDYVIANLDIWGVVQQSSRERFNLFMADEDLTFRIYDPSKVATSTYELGDYFGETVAAGTVTDVLETVGEKHLMVLPNPGPGWYRLYIRRATPIADWGRSQGGCMLAVWRNTPGFHANKTQIEFGSRNYYDDLPMRSMMLGGPERLYIADAADPDGNGDPGAIQTLQTVQLDIDLAHEWYTPFDTDRDKKLFVSFVNYNNLAGENSGVTTVVDAVKDDVRHFEARNEPDGQGAAAWLPKQQAFYDAVKAADPTAQVIGPCPTGIGGPRSASVFRFLEKFLELGGAECIDALSYHDYNGTNGDLILARRNYERLDNLLALHGLSDIERWMTEWGAGAANFGVFSVALQGRFMMLALQVWEQYNLPKERVNWFYDGNHGFWSVPTWSWNQEYTMYAPVSLLRVWSEELYGKTFAKRYSFGNVEDNWTIGSRFESDDGSSVAAFSSAGRTEQTLTLKVSGASELVVVSPFGAESTVDVVDGQAQVTLHNCIPVYVRVPSGVRVNPAVGQYGPDLARGCEVTASTGASGTSKLTDGVLRSYFHGDGDLPFTDIGEPTCHYTLDLVTPTTVDTVVVLGLPPYSGQGGAPLDFDLEYWTGSTWSVLATMTEPANTKADSASDQLLAAAQVESYYSDRCVFVMEFAPVSTTQLRLTVRDCCRGAYPDDITNDARGEAHARRVQLRAWQVYNRSGLPAPKYGALIAS